jgi:hypothetical protein
MLNRLSGVPCDCDTHGANQKISSDVVGHFDFGMTELALPSEGQKRLMIRSVVRAYRDHTLFNKNVSTALEQHIKKAEASDTDRHYLSSFMRHMLSLGDYETYITDDEKKSILGSVFASGKVDPVILDEIRSELGPLTNKFTSQLTGYAEKHPIFRFDDSRRVSQIVIPTLTEDEQAIADGRATAKMSKPVLTSSNLSDATGYDNGPVRLLEKVSYALFGGQARPALAR